MPWMCTAERTRCRVHEVRRRTNAIAAADFWCGLLGFLVSYGPLAVDADMMGGALPLSPNIRLRTTLLESSVVTDFRRLGVCKSREGLHSRLPKSPNTLSLIPASVAAAASADPLAPVFERRAGAPVSNPAAGPGLAADRPGPPAVHALRVAPPLSGPRWSKGPGSRSTPSARSPLC